MSYENFAYYYDSLMDPQFYEDYIKFIDKHCHFDEVLELGCGTGEIAVGLSQKGKSVFATDLSNDMLEVARQKAMYHNVDLKLQKVNMCDFITSYPVDLILCLCDSINYVLDEKDVKQTFLNVFYSLKKDGTFIFDIDSLYKMNVILNDYHEKNEDEEYIFQWDVSLIDNGFVKHHVFIHDKIENEIVDEEHFQKTYDVLQYQTWLHEAGFQYIDIYSDFGDYNEKCERIIFVCRKD